MIVVRNCTTINNISKRIYIYAIAVTITITVTSVNIQFVNGCRNIHSEYNSVVVICLTWSYTPDNCGLCFPNLAYCMKPSLQ